MNKINTLIRKEWAEVFKNRMVLFTVAFLPLLLTAIPVAILASMHGEVTNMQGISSEMPAQFNALCPADLNQGECFQVYLVSQFMIMFMILPLAIPSTISAYSIVGEKTTHSLEPLLATPITTLELLRGKSLAAAIPAVHADRLRAAEASGRQAVALAREPVRPSEVITGRSIEHALRVLLAIDGSSSSEAARRVVDAGLPEDRQGLVRRPLLPRDRRHRLTPGPARPDPSHR